MRTQRRLPAYLALSLLLASTAFGQLPKEEQKDKPPEIPACNDTVVFGKEPEPLKENLKAADTAQATPDEIEKTKKLVEVCLDDLKSARTAFGDKQRALAKAVSDKNTVPAIEGLEKEVGQTRSKYLEKLDACSPVCAIRRVKQKRIISPAKTEIWYESEGSCLISEEKFGKAAYDRIVKYLSRIDNYPAYNPNGLRNILEFMPVDPENGDLRPDWKTVDKPFPVFISVLGPKVLGEIISTNYFLKNELKSEKEPWHLEFTTVPKVKGFQAPKVFLHSAVPGKKTETRPFSLNSVYGHWCVRKGSFTYFTAADFGAAGAISSFTTVLAKYVLLETLIHIYEVGTEEKP